MRALEDADAVFDGNVTRIAPPVVHVYKPPSFTLTALSAVPVSLDNQCVYVTLKKTELLG